MATFTTIHPFVSTLRFERPAAPAQVAAARRTPTARPEDDDWSRDPALAAARTREGDATAEVVALSLALIGHGWVGTGCYWVARERGAPDPIDLGPPTLAAFRELLSEALDGARTLVARLGRGHGARHDSGRPTADEAPGRLFAPWGP
jgi:hypothetical protein